MQISRVITRRALWTGMSLWSILKSSYFFSSGYWSLVDMVLIYRVVLLWVTCLLFKVVLIRCEVTLVNRNVTDSFRIGEDGCTKNIGCPDHATCQLDSGVCLCNDQYPNFLNHSQPSSKGFGCLISKSIRVGVGECLYLILTLQSNWRSSWYSSSTKLHC